MLSPSGQQRWGGGSALRSSLPLGVSGRTGSETQAPGSIASGRLSRRAPRRASRDTPVIFGHWAALGLVVREDVVCLDSGCVWGRRLTALRLEDRRLFECDCAELPEKAVEE